MELRTNSLYFHGLGGVVKGAGDPRIIENTKNSSHFHALGDGVGEAGGPKFFLAITKMSMRLRDLGGDAP